MIFFPFNVSRLLKRSGLIFVWVPFLSNNSGLKKVEFKILKPSFLKIEITLLIIVASPFFAALMIFGK